MIKDLQEEASSILIFTRKFSIEYRGKCGSSFEVDGESLKSVETSGGVTINGIEFDDVEHAGIRIIFHSDCWKIGDDISRESSYKEVQLFNNATFPVKLFYTDRHSADDYYSGESRGRDRNYCLTVDRAQDGQIVAAVSEIFSLHGVK